tara:strand:- start:187 stop:420 length:234 start_codon:yes stop_codon:yes gene_type:complete
MDVEPYIILMIKVGKVLYVKFVKHLYIMRTKNVIEKKILYPLDKSDKIWVCFSYTANFIAYVLFPNQTSNEVSSILL